MNHEVITYPGPIKGGPIGGPIGPIIGWPIGGPNWPIGAIEWGCIGPCGGIIPCIMPPGPGKVPGPLPSRASGFVFFGAGSSSPLLGEPALPPRHIQHTLTATIKQQGNVYSNAAEVQICLCMPGRHMMEWRYNSFLNLSTTGDLSTSHSWCFSRKISLTSTHWKSSEMRLSPGLHSVKKKISSPCKEQNPDSSAV